MAAVRHRRLLKRHHALKPQICLEILSDLHHQPLKWKLHAAGRRSRLARRLGGQLLARCLRNLNSTPLSAPIGVFPIGSMSDPPPNPSISSSSDLLLHSLFPPHLHLRSRPLPPSLSRNPFTHLPSLENPSLLKLPAAAPNTFATRSPIDALSVFNSIKRGACTPPSRSITCSSSCASMARLRKWQRHCFRLLLSLRRTPPPQQNSPRTPQMPAAAPITPSSSLEVPAFATVKIPVKEDPQIGSDPFPGASPHEI